MAAVLPLGTNDRIAGSISAPGEVDEFQVTLTGSGRLTAEVQTRPGCSLDTRLSLLGPDSQLLIQSDGQSLTNHDDLITQHLLAGTYFVKVEGLDGGSGDYTLTTKFEPATAPDQPLVVDFKRSSPWLPTPTFNVTGDFNGDGRLDIATSNFATLGVSVLLGLGDGTFQSGRVFAAGDGPTGIVAGYFNRDAHLDLAVANSGSNDVSVLLGNGDGTFQPEKRFAGGSAALALATADLNGDSSLDLIVVNQTGGVSIVLGNGDGTLQPEKRFATGDSPGQVAVGDFDGDGHLDLAVSNFGSHDVSVLLGNGDGTFLSQGRVTTGTNPQAIVTGDFNGDGQIDLATANSGSDDVSVLLGRGDGTFPAQRRWAVGTTPFGLATGDFSGDGRLDLAVANQHSDDVSVLLGRPDGTFQDQVLYQAGIQPWFVITGDFNGDGRADLATANARSHDVSILLGLGNGTFQPDPASPRPGQTNPLATLAADFNNDGIPDLATVSYTGGNLFIFLGRGDGTFQQRQRLAAEATSVAVAAADFNGDGIPDIVTGNCFSSGVSILLGRGDGTFQPQKSYPASHFVQWVAPGDLNGDGHIDLVTGGDLANNISVLLGRGDGTFQALVTYGSTRGPGGVLGDFNRDGRMDLAVTNTAANVVSILLGRGDGMFSEPVNLAVGSRPLSLVTCDFNGDGRLDLVVTNSGSNGVSVLLGRGDGSFLPDVRYAAGVSPDSILAADFNDDGWLDLAVTNAGSVFVSLLLGRGDGTFQPQVQSAVTDTPTIHRGLAAADYNRDGRLDLAAAQLGPSDISVVLGKGDGSFQAPLRFAVGLGPVAFVTGDFAGHGRLDVASVNPTTNDVAVALGDGDGTLEVPMRFPVGVGPVALVRGDFNGDGRLDLATANFISNDVSVLLGLGDGTFRPALRYPVGTNPTALVAGDFNGDGHSDLAVVNAGSNEVSVLLGTGDGTFQPEARFAAPDLPQALVIGDFNGDGTLDVATANYRSHDIAVFLGRGDGTFLAPLRFALGTAPVSLAAGDFNDDGNVDLATANPTSNDVSILLGRGDGTFQAAVRYEAGTNPLLVATADFNGDGRLDLATANGTANGVSLLLGRGDGTFAPPVQRPVAAYPIALVGDDFNNDGRTDLAIATQLSLQVSLLLGLGNGNFLSPDTITNAIRATPLVADLNGDGTPDVAVVNNRGEILLRLGRPSAPGTFDPSLVLNPDPRFAARELAVTQTGHGLVLAALDARDSALSLYYRGPDGTFTRTPGPTVPGTLPVRLAVGDLNGDGRDDLVVAATASNQVVVYIQHADGSFGPAADYQAGVGVNPSAISLTDVDGDGRLDLVVTNRFSGDVSVLRNDPTAPFSSELRFRAGTGLYWVDQRSGSPMIRTYQGSAGVVAGLFDGDHSTDLVVTNSGSNSFSLLQGTGLGGFVNPQTARTFSTGVRPTAVVAGDFNHDGHPDLAILNEGSNDVSLFLGDGHGGFTEKTVTDPAGRAVRLSAGNAPAGLTLADANSDGNLDLLVGNEYGDVLTLLGNGDGTFQPYQRAGRHIALAVADLNGDGRDDFIFGNEALDRVSVQYSQADQRFALERGDGLLAPGAVSTADLNRDGLADLVVANSGANNVLVYLGTGHGQFGSAQTFFAGTNPASITLADLNGDALPDLVVANEGSNDVTLLLGQAGSTGWTLTPGPRLRAGMGPVSTTVHDVTGDAIPDILVSNSQSNTISLLPGVGNGFFNDRDAIRFATGLSPRQVLVGNFDLAPGLDLVSINAESNDLTFFTNPTFTTSVTGLRVDSGGELPLAAAAADFNFDGVGDLLVVNNGDGRMTLLLGGADGPAFAASFSLAEVPHPTAVAVADSEHDLQVYVTEEGHEAAFLLTSFGIPIPAPTAAVPPVALADVVLLNGPGFATDLSLVLLVGASAQPGDDQRIPEPVHSQGEVPAGGLLAGNLSPGFATLPPGGGAEEEGETAAAVEATTAPEEAGVTRLMLGVEDALRALPPAAPERDATSTPEPVQELLDAIAEVFSTWLGGWIGNPSSPAGDQKPDTVGRDEAVAEFAGVRAEQAAPPNAGEVGSEEPEGELSLPDAEALDMPPLEAVEKHTWAVDYLMAALVHAATWRAGGPVRNARRPAPKKFARQRLISSPQLSC